MGMSEILLDEILSNIFVYLDQLNLYHCTCVSREFHRVIMNDKLLRLQLLCLSSFPQFNKYAQAGRKYYDIRLDTSIGSKKKIRIEYLLDQSPRTIYSNEDLKNNEIKIVAENCTFLLSESRFNDITTVYGIEYENFLISMMLKMRAYLRSGLNNINDIMKENLLKSIKLLNGHFQKDPILSQLVKMRCSLNMSRYGALKDEDNVVESDPEDDFPPKVKNTHIGKCGLYYCKKCDWKIAGFTCQKNMCNTLLVLDENAALKCPKGCGIIQAPECCERYMRCRPLDIAIEPQTYQKNSYTNNTSPLLTCLGCSYAINGIRCFTCGEKYGRYFEKNGFFERVWSSYGWTCPRGCARKKYSGVVASGIFKCKCGEDLTDELTISNPITYF